MPVSNWNDAGVDVWEQWSAHLKQRTQPRTLHQILPEGKCPLVWGLECAGLGAEQPGLESALEDLARVARGKPPRGAAPLATVISDWLTRGERSQPAGQQATADALLAVALAYALPALPAHLGYDRWKQLFHALTALAEGPHDAEPRAGEARAGGTWATAPLDYVWLAAELPLVLSWQFPELEECQPLAALAREAFSQTLEELLDSEGCPSAEHLALIRPLLASCTRAAGIAVQLDEPSWNDAGQSQFSWLVRQALRWTLRDGRAVMLSADSHVSAADEPDRTAPDHTAPDNTDELLIAALRLGGDRDDRRVARIWSPKLSLKKKSKRGKDKPREFAQLPDPAFHSEWAGCSLLRTTWQRDAWLLAVRHDGDAINLALHLGKDLLLAGAWDCDVHLDGEKLAVEGPWESVCWASDADGSYLELAIDLSQDVTLHRQFFLPRDDRFFFAADSLHASRAGRLEYRTRLPLAPRVVLTPADKTREVLVATGDVQGRVFPLGLGEWRSDRRLGDLRVVEDQPYAGNGHSSNGHSNGHAHEGAESNGLAAVSALHLELTSRVSGRRLYAPWFIDLEAKRLSRPFTWRSLTVGEGRAVVPADTAVGYRVQCGKAQWLVYRSLGPIGNRTVLGKNMMSDFLLARFKPAGETQPLIEVEVEQP